MRRDPLDYKELLDIVGRRGLLDAAQVEALQRNHERHLAALARERFGADALGGASIGELAKAFSPIEVLASLGLEGSDGLALGEDRLTQLYADDIGLPYVKLNPLELDARQVTSVISKPFARKHDLLPIEVTSKGLRVATSNPFDQVALDAVKSATKLPIELVITSRSDIQKLITEFFGFQKSVENAQRDLTAGIDISNLEQLVQLKSERELEASDQHVVNAVQYLFSYAFQQRASDIHIEPKRDKSVIRFRIDGVLHSVNELPAVVHKAVVNRIKMLARLDIGERRKPQDGRIKTEHEGKAVELRVSSLPVAFGEKIVLRIFDPAIVDDDLSQLGFTARDLRLFEGFIAEPHGIILVTGPTGSGKTTTLYTALRRVATEAVNVTTIEDPIEMVFERINQTAVHPTAGVTFASALRSILRQDPDVIMVGEIRDLETARHAIQAALTGHLVFSTLHTNDAPSAVARMIDMGIENFLLASTLTGLVAQRLLRKVCLHCATERPLGEQERKSLGVLLPDEPLMVRKGAGCVECRNTGYRGRTAIYEVLPMTNSVRELIMDRADTDSLMQHARDSGMVTLREAAVQKVLDGMTTVDEVLRVTMAAR